jgi:hypothetical protein
MGDFSFAWKHGVGTARETQQGGSPYHDAQDLSDPAMSGLLPDRTHQREGTLAAPYNAIDRSALDNLIWKGRYCRLELTIALDGQ